MHAFAPTSETLSTAPAGAPVALGAALAQREQRAEALAAAIDGALEALAAQLAEGHTAEFLAALAFWGRFHRYSFANAVLIRVQCLHATAVAGLRRWNELGYRVKPGEKAIWIWCPIVKKELDALTGEEAEALVGFRPGPVFDASQLANLGERPLPELVRTLPDDAEGTYRAAVARTEASGIAVEERLLPIGIYGVSQGGKILVRAGLDSRNRLFVLLHELAHELAHRGEAQLAKPVEVRELEAEATAFVAAAALGLESIGSRDYLLTYSLSADDLRAAIGTVHRLARQVMQVVTPSEEGTIRRAA